MNGRAEVDRQKRRLDATFERARAAEADAELLSDLASHLCVLVYGFLEQAVVELLLEHVRHRSDQSVQRYVEARLRRFTTAKATKIMELLGGFDPNWRADLEVFLVDERKDAVDSVVNLRQMISHGRGATPSMATVRGYYDRVKDVVNHLAGLCDPV